jgi:hypothetical protein
MEVFSIVAVIVLLILLYFFFGILVKFIWGWAPLCVSILLSIGLGLTGGTISAVIAIVVFLAGLGLTNSWQGSSLFYRVEEKIDSMFYFKD